MKRLLAFIGMVVMSCGVTGAATFGQPGLVSTPDSEFVTLSDMASLPASASVGEAAAPAQPAVVAQEASAVISTVATPTEQVVSVVATGVTTGAVDSVKAAGVSKAVTNLAAPADNAPELMPVASFSTGSENQNLMSVSLDDVPLQDVVRLFTRISGANIISSSTNLQGKVTVNLQDVEWKPALDSILDMYNLMVTERVPGSGIYSIVNKVAGVEPMIAQPIFLDYAQVSNVVAVVMPMVGKGGMVSPFPNANAVVVRATAADLNSIMKVVKELDVPRQQVYIEAKFIELSDEAIKDLGVNWQVLEAYGVGAKNLSQTLNDSRTKVNSNHTGSDQTDTMKSSDAVQGGNSATLANSTASGPSSSANQNNGQTTSDSIDKSLTYTRGLVHNADQTFTDVRTAVLSADDFRLVLSALQQLNGASVVSNPKIIVANDEVATIHIGQSEPNIKGTVTAGQQGQANTTTYALDPQTPYFEYGISLEVTPTINNLSNISVRISPTLSRFVANKTAPDGNTYPIQTVKKIKTVFSLESGKTAAIGGLTETTDNDNEMKVPLLGDIPLIGKYLFTYKHKQHLQTETIIFVTVGLANPRTIQRDEGLPEETALAQNKLIVMQKVRDQRVADALKASQKAKLERAQLDKTP